jgi:hypothetical protein
MLALVLLPAFILHKNRFQIRSKAYGEGERGIKPRTPSNGPL